VCVCVCVCVYVLFLLKCPIIVALTWLSSRGRGSDAGRSLAPIIIRAESSSYLDVTLCILRALKRYLSIFIVLSI
jgi:hypothetical protein